MIADMNKNPICYAVIVAGGKGSRMGGKTKKQYLPLGNMPMLSRTLSVFDQCGLCDGIFLVVPEEDLSFCQVHVLDPFSFRLPVHLVAGGTSRQDSVYNGLVAARQMIEEGEKNTGKGNPVVLVHDGVRPLVPKKLIRDCMETAFVTGACVPVLPCVDTVKSLDAAEQKVLGTLERSKIGFAQTPQAFDVEILWQAFCHARQTHFMGTDESSLLEHANLNVSIVQGSPRNIKLTTLVDYVLARHLLKDEGLLL